MLNVKRLFAFILFGALLSGSLQDIYLHNPRGSNNRLNEASAARNNNNRLFDSQVPKFPTLLIHQRNFQNFHLLLEQC